MAEAAQYWLMKTEPEAYSIHDLAREPTRTTHWDGVRNYQARNFMRAMQIGDRVLFYHSSAEPPAVVGTAMVARTAYPDFTALDPADKHFDPQASQENPIWGMVDVKLERVFDRPIALDELRATPGLKGMELLRRGSRLSVQPVSKEHFEIVLKLAEKPGSGTTGLAAPPQKRAASPRRVASPKRAATSAKSRRPLKKSKKSGRRSPRP